MNSGALLRTYKQGLGLFLICLVIGLIVQYADLMTEFNANWIDREVRDNGILGALYFVVAGLLMSAVGAPRQLIAFLGGYAFGFSLGSLLALIATLLGCICTFYTARLIMQPLLITKFEKQSAQINAFLGSQPTRKTIVIRLLPIGSNLITNIAAGLTKVKPVSFFNGSAIGYAPQTIVFALFGKGLVIESEWKILLSVLLLLVSSYVSVSIYKSYKKERLFKSEDHFSTLTSSDEIRINEASQKNSEEQR